MSDHPSVVAALEQLQNGATILDLKWNNIGDEGAKAVAAALKENRSLTSLSLWNNKIGSEGAKALAAALKENRSLTTLYLHWNDIGSEGGKAVGAALKENRSLTYLSLHSNYIGHEGAKAVAAALKQNRSLTSVDLGGNNIGDEGAKAVAAALKENRSLTLLSLQSNYIGDEGAKAVGAALKENRSLTSLHLRGNEIGDEGAKAVAAALKENRLLTSLNLKWNNIGDEGAKAVAAALKENRLLTSLNLSENKIGSDGAKAVGAALKENRSLTSLDLSMNQIGYEGAKAVGAALKENRSLTSLDLQSNYIGSEGAKAVGAALTENRSLTSLDLRVNDIGDEGAKAVGAALKENRSLTSLSLQHNQIGDEGAKAVGAALKENRSLTSLDLSENDIGDEGAKAVAAALKENRSLTSLSLKWNNIGDEGAKAVAAALKENRLLTSLNLEWNQIGDEGAKAVLAALDENHVIQEIYLDCFDLSQDVINHIDDRLKLAKDIVDEFTKSALDAFSKDEKVRWGRAKLMVVGKGGSGKTSTIRTLLGQAFVAEHDSTIGVDLKVIRTKDWKEDPMGIHSADLHEALAKHQLFRGQENLAARSSQALLSNNVPAKKRRISESSSNDVPAKKRRISESSSNDVPAKKRRISESSSNDVPAKNRRISESSISALRSDDIPKLKIDSEEVIKSYRADVKVQLEERGCKMVETDISFSIWDYGGQEVFYALHHLFLTNYGVYVVVFDMREVIGKDNFQDCSDYALMEDSEAALNKIRFWLDSIRLHSSGAKFVLVGTYLDALQDTNEDLDLVDSELRVLLAQAGGLQHMRNIEENRSFYPVDNTERQNVSRCELLRNLLVTTAAKEDYVTDPVPLRWSLCFDRMFRTNKDYMELDAVYELATSSCGISKDDATKMLKFMHELGVIVHLTSTPVLANYVILQPQWLLDNLSRVICDPMHMEAHVKKMQKAVTEVEIPTDWYADLETWKKRGVASQLFLSMLWGRPFLVKYFSELMTEMLLASRSPWIGDLDGEEALLIPSLLKPISEGELEDLFSKFEGAALVYIEFGFLPKGVFQRFIASMVSNFPAGLVEVQQVYANVASIIFAGTSVLLVPDDTRRRIIMYLENDEEDEGNDSQRRITNIVQLLHTQLQSINEAFMKQKLNPRLVLSCDGTTNDQSCASISDLAKAEHGKVLSVGRQALDLSSFRLFWASKNEAGGSFFFFVERCAISFLCTIRGILSVLANARRGKVPSIGHRALHLSSFRMFFASKDEAEELESKITAQREKKYDVFLSHAWGKDKRVHNLVCRVSDELQNNHGISCWLDRNEVQHGEITRIMTQGIDDSKLGVVFVTREYMEKVNSIRTRLDYCRYEFEYLVKSKSRVRMIPVVLEQAMTDPGEWIGFFGSWWGISPLYVNMTGGGNVDEVAKLSKRIQNAFKEI